MPSPQKRFLHHTPPTREFLNNPSSIFLGLIIAIFLGTGFWAAFTELDEVIRSSGQVVPASNAKVVQSEFQGKVSTINVSVGDNVKKDFVLEFWYFVHQKWILSGNLKRGGGGVIFFRF